MAKLETANVKDVLNVKKVGLQVITETLNVLLATEEQLGFCPLKLR